MPKPPNKKAVTKKSQKTQPAAAEFKPFWTTAGSDLVKLYQGNVVDVLRKLPTASVHMCVTSPPYWGLRDYGTADWEGGDPNCDHRVKCRKERPELRSGDGKSKGCYSWGERDYTESALAVCPKCGAKRIDQQLGSEKSPDCLGWATGWRCGECHVCRITEVFRELKRVLRDDGTLWLNYGDSMGGCKTLPAGNLVGVPWRVALALQADGWILRQDIIWHKPSPMPESVKNRCTKAHEYVFLLAKRSGYFYDAEAVKEEAGGYRTGGAMNYRGVEGREYLQQNREESYTTANKRSVWSVSDLKQMIEWLASNHPEVAEEYLSLIGNRLDVWRISSQGYEGAHFATFPPKLIEPCILAGTSEKGVCPKCGAPWKRILEEKQLKRERPNDYVKRSGEEGTGNSCANSVAGVETKTLGWEATCDCGIEETTPATVLDVFIGSGTTCCVSIAHGRKSIGIDLSEKYLRDNAIPRIEGELLSRPALAHLAGKVVKKLQLGKRLT